MLRNADVNNVSAALKRSLSTSIMLTKTDMTGLLLNSEERFDDRTCCKSIEGKHAVNTSLMRHIFGRLLEEAL